MPALRMGALIIAFVSMIAPSANACDLKTATNNTRAPGYVSGVQNCLKSLPAGYSIDRQIEQDNIARVNKARVARGLKPLRLREDLRTPARWHSMDMAANNYFSHDEKSKRTHADRISLLDRKLIYSVAKENIAFIRGDRIAGTESETLHRGLMESDSHRAAILSDDITHMASGVVRHENGVWLTQIFVNQMGEFVEPLPTRIRANERLEFAVQLPGWKPIGFDAQQEGETAALVSAGDGKALRVPVGVHGDFQLMVRGERPNTAIIPDKANTEYLLRAAVSGPIMSVEPDSYMIAARRVKDRVKPNVTRIVTRTVKTGTFRKIRISAS